MDIPHILRLVRNNERSHLGLERLTLLAEVHIHSYEKASAVEGTVSASHRDRLNGKNLSEASVRHEYDNILVEGAEGRSHELLVGAVPLLNRHDRVDESDRSAQDAAEDFELTLIRECPLR